HRGGGPAPLWPAGAEAHRGVRWPPGGVARTPARHARRADGHRAPGVPRARCRRARARGALRPRGQVRGPEPGPARGAAGMNGATALEIRNLRKLFFQSTPRGPAGLLVLDDVSLSVREGEFVAALGPSGCGKTTLARIIVGLEDVASGSVLIAGRPAG